MDKFLCILKYLRVYFRRKYYFNDSFYTVFYIYELWGGGVIQNGQLDGAGFP